MTQMATYKSNVPSAHRKPKGQNRTNAPEKANQSKQPNQPSTSTTESAMSQQEELLRQKLGELLGYCNQLKKEAEAKDYEIKSLKKKVEAQGKMLEENHTNTHKYLAIIEEQKADIESDKRMIESLQNNDDLETKEIIIRGLEEKINRLEKEAATEHPPTPETTPSVTPETTTEDKIHQKKRRRSTIEDGLIGCQIVGLKFRTQGTMLKVKLRDVDNYTQEYHAEEVAQKYESETREYLNKLKHNKSRQLHTILRKRIECLTKLI